MINCQVIETRQELANLEESLERKRIIACDLEASELDVRKADLEGIGLGTSAKQYFIVFSNGISQKEVGESLGRIFKDKVVIFHNAKYDLKILSKYGFPLPKKIHDTMIMSWLVDEEGSHGLKALAREILDRQPKEWKNLKKTLDLFTTKESIIEELANYCADDVRNTFDLYFYYLPILKKEDLLTDYERVELPLIHVLKDMELRGVKLDFDWLQNKRDEAEKTLKELEEKMLAKVDGEGVNIHSSQQLEVLLFQKLGYKPIRVLDSGRRSTDNKVLKALVKENDLQEDDFVPMLLKFRELDKIYRTYLIALMEQADENQVVHTHFLQHGTRTGRLASNEPNLQNIPARDDEWNIRKVFVPREGYKFIVADYSQIELRMLAHFSADDNMMDTFAHGGDIHAKTMELTHTKRKEAKAINFGLIYGIGPRSLAQQIHKTEDEAKRYIHKFFSGYPKVRFFIQRIQQKARREGYVEMITGRRRRFKEIRDRRWYNLINRQAINTKIQGSAADLIKIAMIKLHRVLPSVGAYQLLQIHDEVVMEVLEDKIEETKKIIKETMEGVLKLRVPIKVGMEVGDYWVKS